MAEGQDGRVLLKCHAGCETENVVAKLGLAMTDLFSGNAPDARDSDPVVATYVYTDERGRELFEVRRTERKRFYQARVDPNGRRVSGRGCMNSVRRVLYRLPGLLRTIESGETIYLVEGEKDVEALTQAGYVASCNPGGAGKWRNEYADHLRGADVVVIADKDEPGRAHANRVRDSLKDAAKSVRVVASRSGKDVSDHLAAGYTVEELVDLDDNSVGEPIDLAITLAAIENLLRQYIVFRSDAPVVACALWIVHTHIIDQLETTPYLSFTSPEKRCGKTRALDVLEVLVARAWRVVLPSEPVLFRKLDRDQPTLLLDEADAIWNPRARGSAEAIRAVLNAGHRAGATVPRCVGEGRRQDFHDFSVFGAKAIAGIGELPDTIADRSIPIRLERKAPNERVLRFRRREAVSQAVPIRDRLERWASVTDLREARPSVPLELDDRAADGWEPLLAIADAAGEPWARRAREAALTLHAAGEAIEISRGVKLLTDIKTAFEHAYTDTIFTRDLLELLNAMEESPWGGFSDGKGLKPRGLARLLRPYGIRSRGTLRIGSETAKGYGRNQFESAWCRYVDTHEPPPGTSQRHNGAKSGPYVPSDPSHAPSAELRKYADEQGCDGVTEQTPSSPEASAVQLSLDPTELDLAGHPGEVDDDRELF